MQCDRDRGAQLASLGEVPGERFAHALETGVARSFDGRDLRAHSVSLNAVAMCPSTSSRAYSSSLTPSSSL